MRRQQGEIILVTGYAPSAEECVKSNPGSCGQRHFLEMMTSEIHCEG